MKINSILFSVVSLVCSQLSLAIGPPSSFTKTLVVYDKEDTDFSTTHSKFLQLLSDRSLDFEVKSSFEFDNSIFNKNGSNLYQNIIVFPTQSKTLIDETDLLKFQEKGGDLIVITDNHGVQTDLGIYLNQLGIHPSPKGYIYIDYHSEDSSILSNPEFKYISDVKVEQLKFDDSSVALISNSELLIPVLQTSFYSVSASVDEGLINSESVWHSGDQGFQIVSFQALNNARLSWIGSQSFFSDDDFVEELVSDLIDFTFHIKGLIKTEFINHINLETNEASYKVGDLTKFEIGFSTWDGESWVPLNTLEDLQLEFVMLDPYYRLNLTLQSDGVYSTTFKVPDQHGMFTYKIDYKRPGYTYVEEDVVVPVRHLANDEYPRSWEITNSWVYITSYFVVVAGWFAFAWFYVTSDNKSTGKDSKKETKKILEKK